jgi:hypothetical protein
VRPGGAKLKAGVAKRLKAVTADPGRYVGRVPVTSRDFDDLISLVQRFVIWVDPQRP